MKIDDDKAKFRHKMDWSLKNYSVGYRLGYMSRTVPLGFEIQANYEQENMAYKMTGDEDYRDATKTMFVPTALLKVRFGSYTTGAFCPTLELGGSYDYALSYKEKLMVKQLKQRSCQQWILWHCRHRLYHSFNSLALELALLSSVLQVLQQRCCIGW